MKNAIRWSWLLVVATTAVASGISAESATTNGLYLTLPGLSWSLEINASGFTFEERNLSEDGTAARLYAPNTNADMILSAFLEKAPKQGNAEECRAYYWSRAKESSFKKDDVKLSKSGSMALVEYIVKEHLGRKVDQKNINAYLAKDGYWIDIHLSKGDFKLGDDALLQTVLKGICINERFIPSIQDSLEFGSFFYHDKQYRKAIPYFEKVLETEKVSPTLPRDIRLIVTDHLVIAYGISGELKKAQELCEYGLKKEPEYPMFYYNLACAYAEMGNKDRALENLRKAYRYKANMLKGERFPNPKTDSSFVKYRSDPDFAKVLAEHAK